MTFLVYSPVEIFAVGIAAVIAKNFEFSEVTRVLSHDELLLKSRNNKYDMIIFDTVDYNRRYQENLINLLHRSRKSTHLVLFNHYEFYLNLLPSEIKKLRAVLRYDLSTSDFIYIVRYIFHEEDLIPKHLNLFTDKSIIPRGFELSKLTKLSDLELKVAVAFYHEKTPKEIAEELSLKPSSVGTVRMRIMRKLGLNHIKDLRRKYAANNLLELKE